MNKLQQSVLALTLIWHAINSNQATADVKLPAVIGSHMVLQRDMPLPIWGWADADEDVTVTLGEQSTKTTANTNTV
jgi:sialate O-acetylesterase